MCPSLSSCIYLAVLRLKSGSECCQFRVWCRIQNNKHWGEITVSTVDRKLQFLPPSSLSRSCDCYAHFKLVCAPFTNTISLSTFLPVGMPFDWTTRRAGRRASNSGGNNRFEHIARFLRCAIVDVVEPLPPKQQSHQARGAKLTILEQASGANLFNGRNRLCLQNFLILQSPFMECCQTSKIGICITVNGEKALEEVQKIELVYCSVLCRERIKKLWEISRNLRELCRVIQISHDNRQ